jgi:hypothetical protein
MSPDPYSGSYDFTNPQSMNRYSYVLNNPLAFIDPSGLEVCASGDDDSSDDGGGCGDSGDDGGGAGNGGDGGGSGNIGSGAEPPPPGYNPTGVNTSDGNPIYMDANGNIWIGSAGSPDPSNDPSGGFLPFPVGFNYSGFSSFYFSGTAVPARRQQNKQTMQSRMRQAAHSMCGANPATRVAKSAMGGFAIGFGVGAFRGFVAGELFGGEVSLGATGLVGAVTGGFIQGAVGAMNGLATGSALAAECQAGFMYDNN